jgi:plastocyanin
MRFRAVLLLGICLFGCNLFAQAQTGTIKGHVHLTGKLPGNPIIRMGMDPMCSKMNAGKQIIQEYVAASIDGSLANVFVRLQGNFPQTPVSTQPVVIDQRGCMYIPRVIGARVGQTVQIKNSDNLLHNIHGYSGKDNSFNVGQARAGIVSEFKLKNEEVMLHLQCDVHKWMTAYIGVVTNPYFAVTDKMGTFEIDKVPPGTYTIQAWQERYGFVMKTVTVKAGAVATIDFTYTGNEKPTASGIRNLVLSAD